MLCLPELIINWISGQCQASICIYISQWYVINVKWLIGINTVRVRWAWWLCFSVLYLLWRPSAAWQMEPEDDNNIEEFIVILLNKTDGCCYHCYVVHLWRMFITFRASWPAISSTTNSRSTGFYMCGVCLSVTTVCVEIRTMMSCFWEETTGSTLPPFVAAPLFW